MPLISQKFANSLKEFIIESNKIEQKDLDQSIDNFCTKQEQLIYEAIKSITIIIPSGAIIVTTPQGPGSNIQPIILNNVIK